MAEERTKSDSNLESNLNLTDRGTEYSRVKNTCNTTTKTTQTNANEIHANIQNIQHNEGTNTRDERDIRENSNIRNENQSQEPDYNNNSITHSQSQIDNNTQNSASSLNSTFLRKVKQDLSILRKKVARKANQQSSQSSQNKEEIGVPNKKIRKSKSTTSLEFDKTLTTVTTNIKKSITNSLKRDKPTPPQPERRDPNFTEKVLNSRPIDFEANNLSTSARDRQTSEFLAATITSNRTSDFANQTQNKPPQNQVQAFLDQNNNYIFTNPHEREIKQVQQVQGVVAPRRRIQSHNLAPNISSSNNTNSRQIPEQIFRPTTQSYPQERYSEDTGSRTRRNEIYSTNTKERNTNLINNNNLHSQSHTQTADTQSNNSEQNKMDGHSQRYISRSDEVSKNNPIFFIIYKKFKE